MIAMSASMVMTRAASRFGVFQSTVDKPFEVVALLNRITTMLGRVKQYAS